LNILDICIVIVVGYNCFLGLKKGAIKLVLDILALFGGILIALKSTSNIELLIKEHVVIPERYSNIVIFVIIWVLIYIVINTFSDMASKGVKNSLLGPLNSMVGGGVGVLKGVVLLVPVISPMILLNMNLIQTSFIAKSYRPIAFYAKHKLDQSRLGNKLDLWDIDMNSNRDQYVPERLWDMDTPPDREQTL